MKRILVRDGKRVFSCFRAVWAAGLPKDDRDYEVDVIDAWNMTITPAKRIPCPVFPRLRRVGGAPTESKPIAAFAVELPPRPYQAIRIRPARTAPLTARE